MMRFWDCVSYHIHHGEISSNFLSTALCTPSACETPLRTEAVASVIWPNYLRTSRQHRNTIFHSHQNLANMDALTKVLQGTWRGRKSIFTLKQLLGEVSPRKTYQEKKPSTRHGNSWKLNYKVSSFQIIYESQKENKLCPFGRIGNPILFPPRKQTLLLISINLKPLKTAIQLPKKKWYWHTMLSRHGVLPRSLLTFKICHTESLCR